MDKENNFAELKSLYCKFYNPNGAEIEVKELGSCQDLNYRIVAAQSSQKYTLKLFSSSQTTIEDINYQIQCLLYLHHYFQNDNSNGNNNGDVNDKKQNPSLQIPLPQVQQTDERKYYDLVDYDSLPRYMCLLTYLDGLPLSSFKYYSPIFQKQYGKLIAQVCQALASYKPEFERGYGQWDMRQVIHEIHRLQPLVHSLSESTTDIELINEVISRTTPIIECHRGYLREQVIHGDLATYNIIARHNAQYQPEIIGIIDFGDTGTSWTVCELVVAILSSLWYVKTPDDCLIQSLRITEEFHRHYPLTINELTCLWPLLLLRSVHILYTVSYELQLNPTNEYNREQMVMEWNVFHMIQKVNLEVATAAFESILNSNTSEVIVKSLPTSSSCPLFSVSSDLKIASIDFTPKSSHYLGGNWQTNSFFTKINNYLQENPSIVNISQYGETKFYTSEIPASHQPAMIALFSEVFLQPETQIYTPFECTISVVDNNFIKLTALGSGGEGEGEGERNITVLLRGVRLLDHFLTSNLPIKCNANECIGTLASDPYPIDYSSKNLLLPPRLFVQVCYLSDTSALPPLFCTPEMFPHWARVCPSPQILFPQSCRDISHSSTSINDALQRRTNYVAAVQEHYFRKPPLMVRGWKEYLYDDTGRGYLDMVNNVAVLGHCHPAVTAAATSQLHLLNTNSRFIYEELGEFAEMIVSTLPPESNLTKVLFVNSGSEATDLALRIARTVVSEQRQFNRQNNISPIFPRPVDGLHRDTICLEGGYHGITTASDEVSTTLNDNPIALESRPPWIHLVPMPNKFRGKFQKEDNPLEKYLEAVEKKITNLSAAGTPVSVFIAEPLSGNAGGVELPPGYLKQVYDMVHSNGGLCISDEVQVGYGRLGTTFWGFQEHNVIPDIITMAKAAGNGYPLGFVVTTEEIIQKFQVVGSFFSSAGGGPLSCSIGKCILSQIFHENLQKNAHLVGQYLSQALNELSLKFSQHIGCIHGHGLYQGIEIVDDPLTKTPGTAKAYLICEYLLDLGVICHNTGDHSNVLKVKPPLCITKNSAEFFVKSLEQALVRLN